VFGFTKARYRGLAKNANRVFVTAALANLFVSRRRLVGAVHPLWAKTENFNTLTTNPAHRNDAIYARVSF